MSSHVSGQAGWPKYAWLVPAALAATAIGLLCWGAWVYGYDPRWLDGARTWWQPLFRPAQDWPDTCDDIARALISAGDSEPRSVDPESAVRRYLRS